MFCSINHSLKAIFISSGKCSKPEEHGESIPNGISDADEEENMCSGMMA